jgi:site-specific DNA recombinase
MITWRLSGGRLSKARNGGYAGGRAAFGYEVTPDNELVLNPEQAAVVSFIHRLRRRKASYHEIARQLNRRGVPAPGGDRWYAGSVKYIVQNPIYRGKYV